jgi:GntR family transcriptional repressor for pyruvate dehydrogenase complex
MRNQVTPVRRTLGQAVSEEILGWIHGGDLRVGERLPSERELMQQFGVGRNTVREAIQGLVGLGVLDVRPGRGTVVRSVDPDVLDAATVAALLEDQAVEDLYELRLLIEVEIAARAAERGDDDEIAAIEAALARHRRDFARGATTYRADIDFHGAVARATGNAVYVRVLDALSDLLLFTRRRTDAVPRARELGLSGHVEIYDAIVARDPAAAREAMRRHILEAIDAVREVRQGH